MKIMEAIAFGTQFCYSMKKNLPDNGICVCINYNELLSVSNKKQHAKHKTFTYIQKINCCMYNPEPIRIKCASGKCIKRNENN